MGLLDVPPELRLHILSYLDDFAPGRTETIDSTERATPTISRTCRLLREEAMPVYAKTASFVIPLDNELYYHSDRVTLWLDALGSEGLAQVQSLQLSRHWQIKQPVRWHGHVGFYVLFKRINERWQCTAGTYPVANDVRGMRGESVELIRRMIEQRLELAARGGKGLKRSDVELSVAAIGIVASHPISAFDTEQSEDGKRRRRSVWDSMERGLAALESDDGQEMSTRPFFTPY